MDTPEAMNFYGYVGDNPTSRTDPTGEYWVRNKRTGQIWFVRKGPALESDLKYYEATGVDVEVLKTPHNYFDPANGLLYTLYQDSPKPYQVTPQRIGPHYSMTITTQPPEKVGWFSGLTLDQAIDWYSAAFTEGFFAPFKAAYDTIKSIPGAEQKLRDTLDQDVNDVRAAFKKSWARGTVQAIWAAARPLRGYAQFQWETLKGTAKELGDIATFTTPSGIFNYFLTKRPGPYQALTEMGWVHGGLFFQVALAAILHQVAGNAKPLRHFDRYPETGVKSVTRIKPINGTVNVGGAGETPNATNLNPYVPNVGGPGAGIPNRIPYYGEEIGDVFEEGSVKWVESQRLPFQTVDWLKLARGAYRVMAPGGRVLMNVYMYFGEDPAVLEQAFTTAGFKNVYVIYDPRFPTGTFVSATR
jgi:hypothetical protein